MRTRTWYIGIPVVVAACWFFLWSTFHLVPDPMPIHIGPDGEPDGWTTKSLGSAFALVGFAPGIILLAGAGTVGLTRATAQDAGERQRMIAREMNPPVAAWLFWLATIIAVDVTGSLLGHSGPLTLLLMVGAMVLATVVFVRRMVHVHHRVDAAHPPSEKDRRGRWGVYYDPADPEMFMQIEDGMNMALNMARPGSWALVAGLLSVPTLIIVLAALAG